MFMFVSVCVSVFASLCAFVCMGMCVSECVYVSVCVCMWECVRVCVMCVLDAKYSLKTLKKSGWKLKPISYFFLSFPEEKKRSAENYNDLSNGFFSIRSRDAAYIRIQHFEVIFESFVKKTQLLKFSFEAPSI